jgi:hypothetical protein
MASPPLSAGRERHRNDDQRNRGQTLHGHILLLIAQHMLATSSDTRNARARHVTGTKAAFAALGEQRPYTRWTFVAGNALNGKASSHRGREKRFDPAKKEARWIALETPRWVRLSGTRLWGNGALHPFASSNQVACSRTVAVCHAKSMRSGSQGASDANMARWSVCSPETVLRYQKPFRADSCASFNGSWSESPKSSPLFPDGVDSRADRALTHVIGLCETLSQPLQQRLGECVE